MLGTELSCSSTSSPTPKRWKPFQKPCCQPEGCPDHRKLLQYDMKAMLTQLCCFRQAPDWAGRRPCLRCSTCVHRRDSSDSLAGNTGDRQQPHDHLRPILCLSAGLCFHLCPRNLEVRSAASFHAPSLSTPVGVSRPYNQNLSGTYTDIHIHTLIYIYIPGPDRMSHWLVRSSDLLHYCLLSWGQVTHVSAKGEIYGLQS